MPIGVEEVSRDKTFTEFAKHVNRIFRRYLSQAHEIGYGWYGNEAGYYACGIDKNEIDVMIVVGFFAHRLENPNLIKITFLPGYKPKYTSVYTKGEKDGVLEDKDWVTGLTIDRFIFTEDKFDLQANAFSSKYNKEPPYSEIIKKDLQITESNKVKR